MTPSSCLAALTPLAPGAAVASGAVLFESRGVVLVFGDGRSVVPAVSALAGILKVVAFAPDLSEFKSGGANVVAVGGRVVSISGEFGAFHAQAATPGSGAADIGRFSPNADGSFDLVLDLSHKPLLSDNIVRLGYFAPQADQAALADAIAGLCGLVGRFSKPKFVDYEASLCTHGAKGLRGCIECLQVCPARALRSVGDVVALDPRLCQGCASCTLACPTGALSFKRPSRAALRASLRRMLERRKSGPSPVIVAHVPESSARVEADRLPARAQTLQIDALPAFGEELWIEALAMGAAGVVLVRDARAAKEEQALLDRKVAEAQVLLRGIGVSPLRVALVASGAMAAAVDAMPQNAARVNELLAAGTAKRRALLAALDALHAASDGAGAPVALAPGMPFGEVLVNRAHCTLCFGCANVCPAGAFAVEAEPVPRLRFIEANCLQCGLCEPGCPEHAIALKPRFLPDAAARSEARLLHEDELFSCTACDTPFISRRLLASSLKRIAGHPVLGPEGVQRLKMCPACRQHATMAD